MLMWSKSCSTLNAMMCEVSGHYEHDMFLHKEVVSFFKDTAVYKNFIIGISSLVRCCLYFQVARAYYLFINQSNLWIISSKQYQLFQAVCWHRLRKSLWKLSNHILFRLVDTKAGLSFDKSTQATRDFGSNAVVNITVKSYEHDGNSTVHSRGCSEWQLGGDQSSGLLALLEWDSLVADGFPSRRFSISGSVFYIVTSSWLEPTCVTPIP